MKVLSLVVGIADLLILDCNMFTQNSEFCFWVLRSSYVHTQTLNFIFGFCSKFWVLFRFFLLNLITDLWSLVVDQSEVSSFTSSSCSSRSQHAHTQTLNFVYGFCLNLLSGGIAGLDKDNPNPIGKQRKRFLHILQKKYKK